MRSRIVTVNDKMQQGYRYVVVAPLAALSTRSSDLI